MKSISLCLLLITALAALGGCVEKPKMELQALKYDEWSAIALGTIRIDMPGRKYWEAGVSWDGYKVLRNGNIEIKTFEIVDSNRWEIAHGKTPTQMLDEIYNKGAK